jgi:AcrR family transcriptional regulator
MSRTKHQPAARRPGRPPTEEGDAESTKQAIVRRAWALFNRQSYSSLSMDDLARGAGVTKATLYYHYAGKAELFVATIQAQISELVAQMEELRKHTPLDTRAQLAEVVAIWYGSGSEEYNARITFEAIAHLPPAQQEAIHAALEVFNAPLLALMAEGIARGELRQRDPRLLLFAFQQLFVDIDFALLGAETPAQRHTAQQALLDLFMQGAAAEHTSAERTSAD